VVPYRLSGPAIPRPPPGWRWRAPGGRGPPAPHAGIASGPRGGGPRRAAQSGPEPLPTGWSPPSPCWARQAARHFPRSG